jgi:hypothetical protein
MPRLQTVIASAERRLLIDTFQDLVQKTPSLLEPLSGELRVVSMAQGCEGAKQSWRDQSVKVRPR